MTVFPSRLFMIASLQKTKIVSLSGPVLVATANERLAMLTASGKEETAFLPFSAMEVGVFSSVILYTVM